MIGYRKYRKLWRSCSIVTLSVALVLSAMLDEPRPDVVVTFAVSRLDLEQVCFTCQGVILIDTLAST